MGLAIMLHPKQKSEFKIASVFWLLGFFGLTHGANELLDMWAIIKGRNPFLDFVRLIILIVSYIFLFEFGRQLFRITATKSNVLQQKIAKLLDWKILPLIGIIIIISGILSTDFWKIGSIFTRYMLGLPGGFLIGFGFWAFFTYEKSLLEPLKVKKYFKVGGYAFLIYGILGGIIVPKAGFFPANLLNTESFFSTVKLPVQVFRAICALASAWAIVGILEIFNWEIKNKLQLYQDQLRKIMFELSIAEEQERKRISEALHDNISQNLAFSKISLLSLQESHPEIAKELEEPRNLIEHTITFTRSLMFELSPPVLYELGFKSAIEWFAEQIHERHGIITELDYHEIPKDIKREVIILLFKTVRELMFNIVKHAQARKAKISVNSDRENIYLIVEDDGIGFEPVSDTTYTIQGGGFGLLNIRERIQYLGGNLNIQSKKKEGTRVTISVPLKQQRREYK
jgi:signal transduction histidine kinase